MPEGDVVWYTARRLHEALTGRVLTRSDFRVPRLATADLSGDVVSETISRGKHLLTRTKSGLTVHTHLKMDGSWRIRPAAERLRDSHRRCRCRFRGRYCDAGRRQRFDRLARS